MKKLISINLLFLLTMILACDQDSTENKTFKIGVSNPADFSRDIETISVDVSGHACKAASVFDSQTKKELLCQLIDNNADGKNDEFIFQSAFKEKQTKSFRIEIGKASSVSAGKKTTFAKYIPERLDDFAWENDRIAFRVYGEALETAKGNALISSGVDVWGKRVSHPIVEKLYKSKNYHKDQGEGLDFYKVGTSRGCGGLSFVKDGKYYNSKNLL